MAFRFEKTVVLSAAVAVLLLSPAVVRGEIQFQVRHDHWRKYCSGSLVVTESGVSYQEENPKKKPGELHAWSWDFQDIQQLLIAPRMLKVLSYKDNKWKLGSDQEYEFTLDQGDFEAAYSALKDRLDERLVAALAAEIEPLWQLPVKHLKRFAGSEGVLLVGKDLVVYRSEKEGESRTWRLKDIENVSSAGPFQLTLTTYERARTHYGSLKGFDFQLKQALSEERYTALWRSLNRTKGPEVLISILEKESR